MRRKLVMAVSAGALALAALAGGPAAAVAQTNTGALRGFVTTPSGAAVVSAQVAAQSVDMGFVRGAITNDAGFYNLPGLRPGRYDVTFRRIGMAPQTRRVDVLVGQTLTLDITMSDTTVQLAKVVVVAPQTETQGSEVATNITREQIRDLPVKDRNFLDLAGLAPGVQTQKNGQYDKTFAGGAQPAEQVNVFVDGVSYKSDVLLDGVMGQNTSQGNPFPQNAVQEFRVLTQNYKAEYQKASSAIITATTRSGTNVWDGGAFAYGIGKGYVAKDPYAASKGLSAPDFQRLQLGGSLGGPLVKDRLFFFGSYEGNFRDQPSDVLLGPDTSRAPANIVDMLRPYTGRTQTRFRENLFFGKLTYTPADRHSFDLSFSGRHETDVRGFGTAFSAPQTSAQSSEDQAVDVYSATGSYKYQAGDWLNEAQLTGQWSKWNPSPLNGDQVGLNYFGILRVGGRDTRQEFTQNCLCLRDDLTRSGTHWLGDHVFKGGVSADLLAYKSQKYQDANPFFNYRVDESFQRPFEAFIGYGNPNISASNTELGAYLQDDWTVNRRLLLNLGVRWDVETNEFDNSYVTPTALRDSITGPLAPQFYVTDSLGNKIYMLDSLGGFSNYISNGRSSRPPYLGAIQPRLGFSYDLSGDQRTVLFGGFGVYYDRDIWNYMLDERFRRQFEVLHIQFNDSGPTAACPTCVQWDTSYLSKQGLLSLAQSGTAGAPEVFMVNNHARPPKANHFSVGLRQALGSYLVSATYTGQRGTNGFAFVRVTPWGGLGPNYAQAFASTNELKNWYDALQVQVGRQLILDRRWGGSIAYTLAKSQVQGEYFFALDDRYLRPANYPRWPASNDQRHTVVINALTWLPYHVLFSTIMNFGSGFPYSGLDVTKGYGPGQRKTIFFRPPTYPFLGIGHVFATRDVDIRLRKDFTVASGQRTGLQVDLFNAFNQANYGCFNVFLDGTVQAARNFGVPGCAAEGRRVQIGLTYDLGRNTPQ